MSYILNALKKAERDRLREEPADLDDFVGADWDPHRVEKSGNWNLGLALAIIAIAALLFVVFYSLAGRQLNNQVADADSDMMLVEEAEPVGVFEPPKEERPASVEPKKSLVVELTDNAAEQELQLPQIIVAGHLYIRSGSPKNRIFVGEKTLYEGDFIDADWSIEAINFDSMTVRSGVHTAELPLR